VRNGTDEIFTIRLHAARVNMENAASFLGHHVSATFELRAGVVKARRPAYAGRSGAESLDDAEAQLDADHVMADALSLPSQNVVETAARSTRDPQGERSGNARANRAHVARTFGQ
jgi:hypothetical protein